MDNPRANEHETQFPRRLNPDGSYESICPRCYRTVARGSSEALSFAEESHSCGDEFSPSRSLNPYARWSKLQPPQLLVLPINPNTRRSYESTRSVVGSGESAVIFGVEKNGYRSARYAALFSDSEQFDSAIRDWLTGMDEGAFCSKYNANKI